MSKNLSEIFSAPTGELDLVGSLVGVRLYTSNNLKRKYLIAMGKTSKTMPILKTIKSLMDRKILTPIYSTDKLLKSLRKKQPIQIRGFAGLVTGEKDIYIFVETDANIFGFTSNDDLASVTIHELIHFFSDFHAREFFNVFKDDLKKYYNFYFSKLLSCNESKINNKNLNDLVEFIHFKLEPNPFALSNQTLKKYYDMISETYRESSTLDEDVFNAKLTQLIVLIKVIQKLVQAGSTEYISRAVVAYKEIASPLYTAYRYSTGIDVLKSKILCFQELWSTSEVIAVPSISKRPNPNVYKAIGKL
jgi:hypothetical protein